MWVQRPEGCGTIVSQALCAGFLCEQFAATHALCTGPRIRGDLPQTGTLRMVSFVIVTYWISTWPFRRESCDTSIIWSYFFLTSHTHTNTHKHVYTHTNTHSHTQIQTQTHTRTHTHKHTQTHKQAHKSTHMALTWSLYHTNQPFYFIEHELSSVTHRVTAGPPSPAPVTKTTKPLLSSAIARIYSREHFKSILKNFQMKSVFTLFPEREGK